MHNESKEYAYDASGNAMTMSHNYTTTARHSYLYDPRSSVSLLLDYATGIVKES